MREPQFTELSLSQDIDTVKKWCSFVTLYLNWDVHGSAWNIKEISSTLAEDIYKNTIEALTKDKRFKPLTLTEAESLKFRLDIIEDRKVISEAEMKNLDPVKYWVIAIKRDYDKLAVILPNISPKILTGSDFTEILKNKLQEKKFDEKDYIIYSISTNTESNY
jgi:AMMECR1 domain-containing protein